VVTQGMLLWQSVKFGGCLQTSPGTTLLSALAFDNRVAGHEAAFKRLNGNNLDTSCTNLVNFHPIISRVYAVKMLNFCRNPAAI